MNDYELIAKSAAIYLDANVVVKIDNEESGSPFSRILFASLIPIYCSYVVLGEFFKVIGSKRKQKDIGVMGYLYICRQLMNEIKIGKIKIAEPVNDKIQFFEQAERLLKKYGQLGGGDIWHLMAALHLKEKINSTTFVSFDSDTVEAAKSEGLSAIDCNNLNSSELLNTLKI